MISPSHLKYHLRFLLGHMSQCIIAQSSNVVDGIAFSCLKFVRKSSALIKASFQTSPGVTEIVGLNSSFVEAWTKAFVSREQIRDAHLVSAGFGNMSVNIGEHRAVIQQSIRIMDAVHISQ